MDAFFTSKLTHCLPGFTFTWIYISHFSCRPFATIKHNPLLRNRKDDSGDKALLRRMNLLSSSETARGVIGYCRALWRSSAGSH